MDNFVFYPRGLWLNAISTIAIDDNNNKRRQDKVVAPNPIDKDIINGISQIMYEARAFSMESMLNGIQNLSTRKHKILQPHKSTERIKLKKIETRNTYEQIEPKYDNIAHNLLAFKGILSKHSFKRGISLSSTFSLLAYMF